MGRKARQMKKEQRISAIKRIVRNYGIARPNFNLEACEWFCRFDIMHNTNGQYATNGGEKCIAGYFVDYFNEDLKLIMEWDEERKYDQYGNLNECDVRRQDEIMKLYPNFDFIRIRG